MGLFHGLPTNYLPSAASCIAGSEAAAAVAACLENDPYAAELLSTLGL